MPSTSRAQQRLFQAAAHGATFAKAKKIQRTMSPGQIKEFATLKKPPMTPRLGNRYATHLRGK